MALQQFFQATVDFKTKKERAGRPFTGSFALRDKLNKSSGVYFLKQRWQINVASLINIQSNQSKMNASTQSGNILINN